jgi:hypothetical protein
MRLTRKNIGKFHSIFFSKPQFLNNCFIQELKTITIPPREKDLKEKSSSPFPIMSFGLD